MNQEHHELRIDDIGRGTSHLIEANAGTGKTYAIANLFLRFVLEGTPVQNLLVVTFTTAATDELRGRIRKRLNEARQMLTQGRADDNEDEFFRSLPGGFLAGEERNEATLHLALALLDINEAPIHTIHGFCQQALSDQAFGSGQAFDLEQANDDDLKLRAMRDWWRRRTYKLSQEELADFLTMFPNFDNLKTQLEDLLKVPAPTLQPSPLSKDDIKAAKEELQDALCSMAKHWSQNHDKACELLLAQNTPLNRGRHRIATLERVIDSFDKSLLDPAPKLPEIKHLQAISRSRFTFRQAATEEERSHFDLEAFSQAERLSKIMERIQPLCIVSELADARDFVHEQLTTIKQRLGLLSFDDMIGRLHKALHRESAAANGLAQNLAASYPVILVDEFQDTDALQYAIFSRIHKAAPDHTLIMIGDPKQAIYGFRGGDIFTYMQARHEADHRWSLATNWRSTPEMIKAVNALFAGANTFTYTDIPYEPSSPAPKEKRKACSLIFNGEQQPALVVQDLPRKDNGGHMTSKGEVHDHVHQAVAQRIAELLNDGKTRLGNEPLRPAEIAILVRTSDEAKEVRQALLKRGVRAISAGRDSIWKSDEAEGLRRLLEAALLPGDRSLLRQALAAPLLSLTARELHNTISDPQRWSAWVELHQEAGERLRKRGFMPAFQTLLHGLAPILAPVSEDGVSDQSDWLTRVRDPERTLTNLLHLADLLQQASHEHPGGEQLLAWMCQQQEQKQNEDNELRLESDEELVKIVTMHSSKGLEFPVVFAPYLWSCRPANHSGNSSMSWHEKDGGAFRHYHTPWLDKESPALIRAEHERLAEDVRLAYVALTRAASHCHIFFGPAGSRDGHSGQTALAWLLSKRELDLDQASFSIAAANVTLQPLEGKPHIALLPPQQDLAPHRIATETLSADNLQTASFTRRIRSNWRVGSYSAMTRDVHQATRVSTAPDGGDFALQYPAGARVGSFLHALLEHLDPGQNIAVQLRRLLPSLSLRHGLDPNKQDLDGLADWLHDILHTPLDDTGMTLAGLERSHTLRELEFDLGTREVDCRSLDALLQEQAGPNLPPLQFDAFQGMITGVIDLVFEHAGRYYLADYKSNLLGRRLEDYVLEKLSAEIDARRYDLQYLLYTVALHRHLRHRIPDYDYQRDFGGVYYLFLRAMRQGSGSRYGVYFRLPDAALVDRLDREIFTYPLENIA